MYLLHFLHDSHKRLRCWVVSLLTGLLAVLLLPAGIAAQPDTLIGPQQVISTGIQGPWSLHLADLDGDDTTDVLAAGVNNNTIAWFRNLGNGNFSGPQIISTSAESPMGVYAADLDGDGANDVISASYFDNTIAWYPNLRNGNFGEQRILSTKAHAAMSVLATDLNNDGRLDVVSASYDDDKIAWYLNLGNSDFSGQRPVSTIADGVESIDAADLDGDGFRDVVSASYGDDKIAWYRNQGDSTFSEPQIISTSADGATSVHAADLDVDGAIDVISSSRVDNKIAWYRNQGDTSFGEQRVISTSVSGAQSVYAADLDSDGYPDVLSASFGDDKIAWYRNLGDGSFGGQQIISTGADMAMSVRAAELDGDGAIDVVSASYGDDKIAWYKNLITPRIVAQDDYFTIAEDHTAKIPILTNDRIPYPLITSIDIRTQSSHGTAVLFNDSLLYRPDDNYYGRDSLSYTLTDTAGSDIAWVRIEIRSVNDPPVAEASITSRQQVEDGYEVEFADRSSDPADPEGHIAGWQWQFGDDSTSNEASPTHIYTTDGSHTVVLVVTDNEGAADSTSLLVEVSLTGIDEPALPARYALRANYPNPFNPGTTIGYDLPEQAIVTLRVYNIAGKQVATLVNDIRAAGSYSVTFEPGNLPSGLYIYRLETASFTATKKMLLIK